MSLLGVPELQKTTHLASTEPADADVSTWKDDHMGIGLGTDGSTWLLYKKGTEVRYVILEGVPQ